MRTIIIAAVLLLSMLSGVAVSAEPYHITPTAVANRCNGEFSAAVIPCSCSVKNRILAGWSEAKVLSAYYAKDAQASPEQIAAVAAVLSGVTFCSDQLYFMWSRADVEALGLQEYPPALVVKDGDREVRFYSRWFRKQ